MDTGLLLIRVTIGVLLVGHGAQHALGWFGGYGADGTGGWLEGFGFAHGRRMALLLGWYLWMSWQRWEFFRQTNRTDI